jgi:5S rRNA maturation endonuclease (ribonuclease M5)
MNNNNYIQKVLEGEIEELRRAEGGRNNALFRVATRLFQFVEGGSLSEDYVTELLFNEVTSLKLPAPEARTTLKSARLKVLGKPAAIPFAGQPKEVSLTTPDPAVAPNETWQQTAKAFVDWSFMNMWGKGNVNAILYLEKRQISGITAMRHHLGYNPKTLYRPRLKWGLSEDESDTLVIPEGIVIPYFIDKKIWKIEVRSIEGKNKHTIAGSANALWGYDDIDIRKPIMLTEGVINGLTIAEYAHNYVQPVALGAITHARKIKFMSKLSAAQVVIIATDSDIAGESGASWWKEVLKHNSVRWKPMFGDINDMAIKEQDVTAWIESGLDYAYDTLFVNESNT